MLCWCSPAFGSTLFRCMPDALWSAMPLSNKGLVLAHGVKLFLQARHHIREAVVLRSEGLVAALPATKLLGLNGKVGKVGKVDVLLKKNQTAPHFFQSQLPFF